MWQVMDEIRAKVDGLIDRQPYNIDENVVDEPNGWLWPQPVYERGQAYMNPWSMPYLTPQDVRCLVVAAFFFLTLAMILRR